MSKPISRMTAYRQRIRTSTTFDLHPDPNVESNNDLTSYAFGDDSTYSPSSFINVRGDENDSNDQFPNPTNDDTNMEENPDASRLQHHESSSIENLEMHCSNEPDPDHSAFEQIE